MHHPCSIIWNSHNAICIHNGAQSSADPAPPQAFFDKLGASRHPRLDWNARRHGMNRQDRQAREDGMDISAGCDIVGDVHGHCAKLEVLLAQLGYRKTKGAWRHPDGRKVLFVGDLIDRGPAQLKTCTLVRGMVEEGEALCIMGNHEYNAVQHQLGYRDLRGGRDPHHTFLKEAPKGSPAYGDWLAWFMRLPLWLDLGPFCLIHACWDEAAMRVLQEAGLGEEAVMDEELFRLAGRGRKAEPGTAERAVHDAMEIVLKGREIPLPEGHVFNDKDGIERREIRTCWWKEDAKTYKEFAFMADKTGIPEVPLPDALKPIRPAKPVFIGHYWLAPDVPALQSARVACVDYSAGQGGPLVAYCWQPGDAELCVSRFVSYDLEVQS